MIDIPLNLPITTEYLPVSLVELNLGQKSVSMDAPVLIKTSTGSNSSFYINENTGRYFSYPFHFHPEYELTYIVEGTGTRFVGNSIENFGPGDLVLIGSNVPHYWRNSQAYYEPESELCVEAIVVRFLYTLGGVNLFEIPEMIALKKLLQESGKGIKITGDCSAGVAAVLQKMLHAERENKLILLLQALSLIAASKSDRQVLMKAVASPINEVEIVRINDIYEYMLLHYKEKITLEEIASVAHLQTASFCRYFKKHFRKTFVETVNEIRINEACNLLRQKDTSITNIAYDCGFNSLSNFINVFFKVTRYKPKQYQKQYL